LAIKEKFETKGFMPVDPLISNTKYRRKKATTLSVAEANLTPNKAQTSNNLRSTYLW
jgi:hypothetical protein